MAEGGGSLPQAGAIKTINLKPDMPAVPEALQRLELALMQARREKCSIIKFIHGYGSSGVGGDIRFAVQRRLYEMKASGEIREYIFGEDWARSDRATWSLLHECPELKSDSDLGRKNAGITIVVL